jgi:hypothetical protein
MKNKHLAGGLFAAKPTPLIEKETSISSAVKEYLDNRGIFNERLNSGKVETKNGNWIHLCDKGTPDRLAIVRGQSIFIETKTLGKKPTTEQLEKHDELRASGAIVIVADSYHQFVDQFSAIRAAVEEARRGEMNLYD